MVCVGVFLVVFGLLLRHLGIQELQKLGLSLNDIETIKQPPEYTNKGIYKHLKHPLYIGAVFMIGGVGIMVFGIKGIVLVMPSLPFYFDRILKEESLRKGEV